MGDRTACRTRARLRREKEGPARLAEGEVRTLPRRAGGAGHARRSARRREADHRAGGPLHRRAGRQDAGQAPRDLPHGPEPYRAQEEQDCDSPPLLMGPGNTGSRGSAPPPADLNELRRELLEAAEPERVPELQRFFKTRPGGYGEGDVFLGVRVPAVRVVARRHAGLNLEDVTKLLRSPVHEERLAALVILVRRYGRANEQERQRLRVSPRELRRASHRRVPGSFRRP